MLDMARDNGATRFLLTSTGLVYGPLYYGMESVAETDDDRARTDQFRPVLRLAKRARLSANTPSSDVLAGW